jgi:hypothetical protein
MELLDNLRAVNTGQRKHISATLYSITVSDPVPSYTVRYATQYNISVTLGANQWIDQDVIQRSGGAVITQAVSALQEIADQTKDVTPEIVNLEIAIHSVHSYANDILKDIE